MDASALENQASCRGNHHGLIVMAKANKDFIKFTTGSILLIVGVTLILAWWPDVVRLFRGGLGIAMALVGLFLLYLINK